MLGIMSLAETELAAIQSLQWVMFSGHAALLATATFALAAVLLLLSQRRARRFSVSSPAGEASALEHLPLPPGPRGYPLVGYLGLLKIFGVKLLIITNQKLREKGTSLFPFFLCPCAVF